MMKPRGRTNVSTMINWNRNEYYWMVMAFGRRVEYYLPQMDTVAAYPATWHNHTNQSPIRHIDCIHTCQVWLVWTVHSISLTVHAPSHAPAFRCTTKAPTRSTRLNISGCVFCIRHSLIIMLCLTSFYRLSPCGKMDNRLPHIVRPSMRQ